MKKLCGLLFVAVSAPAATFFYASDHFLSNKETANAESKVEIDLSSSETNSVEHKENKELSSDSEDTKKMSNSEEKKQSQTPTSEFVSTVQDSNYR